MKAATATIHPVDEASPKREAILSAALTLFSERGFHGTPVPLIADRARVGAGTIYRYFASKEALVNVLYQRCKGELGQMILQDFPFEAPEREQFRMWWRRMARYAVTNPTAYAFLELHHHAPYLDAASKEVEMRVLTPAAMFVDQARAKGVTKDLPTQVLMAIAYGCFLGIYKAKCAGFLEITPEVVEGAEAAAWAAIAR